MSCQQCGKASFATHVYGCYELAGIPRAKLGLPNERDHALSGVQRQVLEDIKGSVTAQHMHYECKPPQG